MAERMYFFDSTKDDKRIYQAADFARFHHQIIGNGVSNDANKPNLKVEENKNLDVHLGAGYMFANGYMYENTATKTLKVDTASSTNDRIDRVIIRFDSNPEERKIYATIKKGTASANPSPPPVERSNYIHEMSVAQIRVKKGSSIITQSQITDERTNDAVCGYIQLHNIYRGLKINELGVVSFPNQSFIKARNNSPQTFKAGVPLAESFPIKLGGTEVDTQREIKNSEQIEIKTDGIYSFWTEVAFNSGEVNAGAKLDTYLFVNGRQSFPLGSKFFAGGRDRFAIASGFDNLKAGDIVDFRVTTIGFEKDVTTDFTRVRVAKTA